MKFLKYMALCAAAFSLGSCADDFLDKEPSEYASEDQIKEVIETDPSAI